jgi:hypothetical protein
MIPARVEGQPAPPEHEKANESIGWASHGWSSVGVPPA